MDLNLGTVDTPPRDAASVVVLRDSSDGLEVLLVRRHAQTKVLGGACVFPGGKLDPADSSAHVLDCLDRSPQALKHQLAEADLSHERSAACFVAAAREAFEEVGLLFAQMPQALSPTDLAQARQRLSSGQSFGSLLAEWGAQLSSAALLPWSRWITPRQPSVMNQRFDTRFFLAALPDGQSACADQHEVTQVLWLKPRQALEQYRDHVIDLAPPQILSLVHLARFHDSASALAQARSQAPALVAPEPFDEQGVRVLTYPGDERHSVRQRALPGPTRLRYQNQRFLPEAGFEAFFAPADPVPPAVTP